MSLRYREFRCHPALQPFVRLVWMLEVDRPAEFGPAERIVPDGIVEAVFNYRTPLSIQFAGRSATLQPTSTLVSQTTRYIDIEPTGPCGFVSVRFQPWGAYHFLSCPVADLADRSVPAYEVWGRTAMTEVEEHLAESTSDTERVNVVQGFLLEQLEHCQKSDVAPLVRAVWQHRGRLRVESLCQALGLSQRSLERTFATALGVTPKHLARLSRFLRACELMRQNAQPTLARVAQETGFYDQAHFTNDFRAFSGMTPREFLGREHVAFLEID